MGYSGWGVPWSSTRACTSKSFKFTAACHLAPRRTMPAVYATNLAYAGSCGTGEGKRACTWGGWRGSNYRPGRSWCRSACHTRAEFGMCAGHGVRSPTSSKVQEAGSKSRSWQGRSSASQPSRCRASPWRAGHAGAVATARPSTLFKTATAGEVSPVCCFDFGLAPEYAFWFV